MVVGNILQGYFGTTYKHKYLIRIINRVLAKNNSGRYSIRNNDKKQINLYNRKFDPILMTYKC